MAVGVIGNTFSTTVANQQVITEQNFADTGATVTNLFQSPGGAFQNAFGWGVVAGALVYSHNTNGSLGFAGAPAGTEFVGWNLLVRKGQIINAVDFQIFQGGATGNVVGIAQNTSMGTNGVAPIGPTVTSSTGPASGGQKIITVTLGSPITVDATMNFYARWTPKNTGDTFYGFLVR
jgi:hypothetical protein